LVAATLEDPTATAGGIEVTFFVPCLNEEERLVPTLKTIQEAMREFPFAYEILVVDDGSSDRTFEVAEQFRREHPELSLCVHRNPRNLGLSRSFVDSAFRGRGTHYRLVCGDNVEPKETMVTILKMLGKADIVVPYYPVLPGKSPTRRVISRTFTLLVDLLSGYRLQYYNGCALYRRYHVMRWAPYNYGFGFQADLITRLLDEGASYVEVPVSGFHLTKERGRSAITFRNFVSTGHTLFEILLRRIRRIVYGG
jgi:glycosyltransferase involved in cell wall biosynthesis